MKRAYKLLGKHRHYDWGGKKFIPELMGIDNQAQIAYAEYWLGAHPSAASAVPELSSEESLHALIENNPIAWLGEKVNKEFGTLPYLLKILDVENMLSIQVHPTKQDAIAGYAKENTIGIPLNASHRNYKDQNHKPEVMVALSDFWLLHGFLEPELMQTRLRSIQPLNAVMSFFEGANYKQLYSNLMKMKEDAADAILRPLLEIAFEAVGKGEVDKNHPHWWAHKYYGGKMPSTSIDKGIFSIYILNIVYLKKFQGIFQGAGLLHAYLEGQNIELMANSDNVLRGGLTSKHIDVEELLQHVVFEPTYPNTLNGTALNAYEQIYPCPVPDFGLSKIELPIGQQYLNKSQSLEMLLLIDGNVKVDQITLKPGETAMLLPNEEVSISTEKEGVSSAILFKSFVP